jgi:hypothetical protein
MQNLPCRSLSENTERAERKSLVDGRNRGKPLFFCAGWVVAYPNAKPSRVVPSGLPVIRKLAKRKSRKTAVSQDSRFWRRAANSTLASPLYRSPEHPPEPLPALASTPTVPESR